VRKPARKDNPHVMKRRGLAPLDISVTNPQTNSA
jgi:hypothetical protein